jgi:hypothetical protein
MSRSSRKSDPIKRRPLSGSLPPNAAELWGATLPSVSELAIRAERVRRTERDAPAPQVPLDCITPTRSFGEAAWSIALMLAFVLLCAWSTGALHLH